MAVETAVLDPVVVLSKDLRVAASTLTLNEARWLVDYYYALQGNRIRLNNQIKAMKEEPHAIIAWMAGQTETLERNIRIALDKFSDAHVVGRWSKSIVGIGPVLAAGLLAHIDITKAPTVGHIWRFAGLDPTVKWEKGQKRPWNADLKVVCWKIGESFKKVKGNEDDVYGKFYEKRKALEWERNLAGEYADQARTKLATVRLGEDTTARLWYSGKLSPTWAREVLVLPAVVHLGHVDVIPAPNWPMKE